MRDGCGLPEDLTFLTDYQSAHFNTHPSPAVPLDAEVFGQHNVRVVELLGW